MSALLHAFMAGLSLLILGAQLCFLDHPVFGGLLLFSGLELTGFGLFALWLERGAPADPSASGQS